MELKSVTWNIGGGKQLKDNEDPTLMASYSVEAIPQITTWLKHENPDIITLQEVQGDAHGNQVEEIAQSLGYEHYFFDATSDSFIDQHKKLGNGIISRFPISKHVSRVFLDPHLEAILQGRHIHTHDKGVSSCVVRIGGYDIELMTLHLLPFRALGIELGSEIGKRLISDIVAKLSAHSQCALLQGDFNLDREKIVDVMPDLFKGQLEEITLNVATTPSGRRYDHVLYRGMSLQKFVVDSNVKTDHYPVTSYFILP